VPRISAEDILNRFGYDESILSVTIEHFKRMVREFSNKERQLLLKFITGSSRLTNSGQVFYVNDIGQHEFDDNL